MTAIKIIIISIDPKSLHHHLTRNKMTIQTPMRDWVPIWREDDQRKTKGATRGKETEFIAFRTFQLF